MSCSSNVKEVDPKYPQDIVPILFDFSEYLPITDPIVSAVVIAFTESGVDLSPIGLINGPPMLNIAQPSHVIQWVKDGLPGVLYGFVCDATTTSGQVLSLPCLMKVISL